MKPPNDDLSSHSSGSGSIEKTNIDSLLYENGLQYTPDGQFIRWSASNRKHPRNWPLAHKIYDTTLIIFLDCFR